MQVDTKIVLEPVMRGVQVEGMMVVVLMVTLFVAFLFRGMGLGYLKEDLLFSSVATTTHARCAT